MFNGKLVVAFTNLTSWSKLVGRVRQLERQKSRRSQGVWYLWHMSIRLQQLASFTKPVYCFCEGIYQSLALYYLYGTVFYGLTGQ